MAYELGVDLGTTFSTVAIARDGHVEMADVGAHSFAVPSVIYVAPDGRVLVGEVAQRRAATDPTLVAREVKRRLGDAAPVLVGSNAYSATLLTAALLRGVVTRVVRSEAEPPGRITLAHPANWGRYRLDVFAEAAQLSGVGKDFEFIPEPVAAAIWHTNRERIPTGAVVAVYDLGGGTFDAAVLRKTDRSFEVLGEPLGLERLGGIDFDEAIIEFVDRCLDGALRSLDPRSDASARTMRVVREEVVAAKESLSTDVAATVNVALPSGLEAVRLTRREFDAMIEPLVRQTIGVLQATLELADVTVGALHKVLLVGGSSRAPLIAELIERELGVAAALDEHPKNAIALGAAAARILEHAAPSASVGVLERGEPLDADRAPTDRREPDAAAAAAVAASGSGPEVGPRPVGPPVGERRSGDTTGSAGIEVPPGLALVVATGPDGGAALALPDGEALTIGRDLPSDVLLRDLRVSRRHVRVQADGDVARLEDLGSSNGCVVDGELVAAAVLQEGQALRLGNTVAILGAHRTVAGVAGPPVGAGAPAATMIAGFVPPAPAPGGGGDGPAGEAGVEPVQLPSATSSQRRRSTGATDGYVAELHALRPLIQQRRREVAGLRRRRNPVAAWRQVRRVAPRRRTDGEFMQLVLGLGDRPTEVTFLSPELTAEEAAVRDEFLAPFALDHDVPIVAAPAPGDAVWVDGTVDAAAAVLRELVAQIVLYHTAADVAVGVVLDDGAGAGTASPLGLARPVWQSIAHLHGPSGQPRIADATALAAMLDREAADGRLAGRRLVLVDAGSTTGAALRHRAPSSVWLGRLGGAPTPTPQPPADAVGSRDTVLHLDVHDGLASVAGPAAEAFGRVLPVTLDVAHATRLLSAARGPTRSGTGARRP